MRNFDALPPPLRGWLAHAALPWSPASCLRIWTEGRRRGKTVEQIMERLAASERKALERDAIVPPQIHACGDLRCEPSAILVRGG